MSVQSADVATSESGTQVLKEAVVNPFNGEVVDVSGWTDEKMLDELASWDDLRRDYDERFRAAENGFKLLLEARVRARGAKGIPHPAYVAEIEVEYGPPIVNLNALREAQKYLKPSETPLVKHVPEYQPPPVPARDEPAAAVTIAATMKRYAGHRVAELCASGYHKPVIGTRFVFKRVKQQPKPVVQIEQE
jgi:hypothetical protein